VQKYLETYQRVLIVGCDNVGSKQMQHVRIALRGECEILMGKNTMIRRAILNSENAEYENLLPHIKGNVGMIFTNSDAVSVRNVLTANRVSAPARVGAIAPEPIIVPAGPTVRAVLPAVLEINGLEVGAHICCLANG